MLFAGVLRTYAEHVLCASRTVVLFDHLRVPYRVDESARWPAAVAAVWAPGRESHALLWPTPARDMGSFAGLPVRSCAGETLDAVAHLLGGTWSTDAEGVRVDELGRRLLPFDLDAAVVDAWSEAYRDRGAAKSRIVRAYYAVRPLLPRRLQIALRRAFVHVQKRSSFPRWPLEPALHDLCDRALDYAADAAGEPLPYLLPWPDRRTWALVLTHDVEHAAGCERIPAVAAVEREAGVRSSWNFVPRRYAVAPGLMETLRGDGFEIGVHGLYHDGRDLAKGVFPERLPAMQAAGVEWGAAGFRSPATHRSWRSMGELGFDYDSSYPDTDPYEPQAGGCCSLVPFFNRDVVELPITLPQDHTLFTILRRTGAATWIEKTDAIRARGGMALLITHPDYMDDDVLGAYREYLARFADARDAWHALPRDVSAWWRRRAASLPVRDGDGWRVDGPAAEQATIAFAAPGRRYGTSLGPASTAGPAGRATPTKSVLGNAPGFPAPRAHVSDGDSVGSGMAFESENEDENGVVQTGSQRAACEPHVVVQSDVKTLYE